MKRKIYCIFQNGSNPAYRNGILAVCTSLKKAIKLITDKYEYEVARLKPKEYNLTINGAMTYFRFSDEDTGAWMKVEILEEQMNKFIR